MSNNVFDELDELDKIQYIYDENNNNDENYDEYILRQPDNIQHIINFSKDHLLISSQSNINLYKQPSQKSYDARKIWIQANIPPNAMIREIEIKLIVWAFIYASLNIENITIKSISWNVNSGYCISTWSAFLRWIICASLS